MIARVIYVEKINSEWKYCALSCIFSILGHWMDEFHFKTEKQKFPAKLRIYKSRNEFLKM